MSYTTSLWWQLLLLSLFSLGTVVPALGGPESRESSIGRLSVYRDGPKDKLMASVIEPRPGKIFKLVNWEALVERGLPPRVKSGALVRVVGRRLAEGTTAAGYRFEAESIALVRPAPPSKLMADGSIKPQAVAGLNLKTLVLRPRLPLNCTANAAEAERTSGNSPQDWQAVFPKLNALQNTCTGGRLTYQAPVVSAYVDIPCTPMPKGSRCDFSVIERMSEDVLTTAQSDLKINTDGFDHIIFDLPKSVSCPWIARAILTWREVYAARLMSADSVAHEFGHNYGLPHSALLSLGSNQPLPPNMPVDNTFDDTNLMAYSYGPGACFSFPHSALIGLAAPAARITRQALPVAKSKTYTLRPTWTKGGQGITIKGFLPGQGNWTIWASYQVTTSSPYPSLLSNPIYNKAVIIHLSSSDYISWTVPFVYRVRVLQSGDVWKWTHTGLAFKFADVGSDGQSAKVEVCRETRRRKCSFGTSSMSGEGSPLVRLAAPSMDSSSPSWCLRGCSTKSCRQSKLPVRVWFTSPCRTISTTAWYSVPHSSGYVRWVHQASGKCLAVNKATTLTDWGTNWWEGKNRLVLLPCNNQAPPDFRKNPQLFRPQTAAADSGLVTLRSGMLFQQGYGVTYESCVEACNSLNSTSGAPQSICARGVPSSTGKVRNTMALTSLCWPPAPSASDREVDRQLMELQ